MTEQTAAPVSPAPAAATRTPRGGLDPVPGDWRRVSPRYVWVDLVGTIISWLIGTAAFTVPFWVTQLTWLLAIPAAVLVAGIIVAAFTPRRVRAIGYRLRDDDLLVRRGIMFQRFAAVPYGRMQLVDINRGPLDRALGLSEVKLVTAASASNVAIPGLPMADAEELRDRLVELAESRRAGL
ncbi:MAG: PH domain-containing protein [Pseudolysinimonas sp.]